MGILRKFKKIPTYKNLIREWPNEVVLNIFNLSDKLVRLLPIFFDELLDRYNVEMLLKLNLWTN